MENQTYDDVTFSKNNLQSPTLNEGLNWSPFMFICIVIALVCFGLVTLYSASYDEAIRHGLASSYYFSRQIIFAFLGFIVFFVIRWIPLRWIRRAIPYLFIISFILMLLTLVTPWGVERLGARRWLQIGPLPSFQPSELLKVSVVLYVAHILSKWDGHSFLPIGLSITIIIISALLIVVQRDYSTTLIFLLVALALLAIGGLRLRYIGMVTVGVGVPSLIFLFIEPYRIRRIVSFLFPTIDPSGLNWQVRKSLEAIAAGGMWGKGLGNGTFKLGIIPEVQSDFIFASLAEELGFSGVILVFLLFLGFAFLGFSTARRFYTTSFKHRFIALASFGITFMIIWQALINLAVVTALLPPTGIPLPFFSQGGTNLFIILCECGFLYRCMVIDEKELAAYE